MLSFQTLGRWMMLMALGAGSLPLQAAGGHANPMDILNGRPQKSTASALKKTERPVRPRRHISPMDVLQGRPGRHKKKQPPTPKPAAMTTTRPKPSAASRPIPVPATPPSDEGISYETPPTSGSEVEVIPLDETPVDVTAAVPENRPVSSETPANAPQNMPKPAKKTPPKKWEKQSKPPHKKHATPTATAAPTVHPTPLTHLHAPRNKVLFLTFDDGPVRGTANLLRILKEEGVKATLFCIGKRVEKDPETFRQALATPEVLVANHTYSHANNHYRRFYTGKTLNVVNDIDRAQKLIGGPKYLRLAGRDVWRLPRLKRNDWAINVAQRNKEIAKYDALANRGYFIYGWDIEWRFSHVTQKPLFGGAEMARRVETLYRSGAMARPGKVVLLAHDYMWRTPASARQLRLFLKIMKERGWRFETIDQYVNITPEAYAKTHIKKAPIVRPAQKLARKAKILPAEKAPRIVTQLSKPAKKPTRTELVTMLNDAISKQQFIRMRRLIARGADINGLDAQGRLPLNVAIQTNNAVMVRMLVERGANIFKVDAEGMSPMGVARQHKNTIIIRYLIRQINKQRQHRLRKTLFAAGTIPFAG